MASFHRWLRVCGDPNRARTPEPGGFTAEFDHGAPDQAACHRDDFDGQRKCTECCYQFAVVGDADEALACCSDDLLARERATSALYQSEVFVGFIGAVDVDGEGACGVQVEYLDAVAAQSGGAGLGTCNRLANVRALGGEQIDEMVGCRARADTDQAIRRHFCQCSARGGDFLRLCCHVGGLVWKVGMIPSAPFTRPP